LRPTRPQVTVCNRLVLPNQAALNFTQHFAQHPKETLQILLSLTAAAAAASFAFLELLLPRRRFYFWNLAATCMSAGEWSGYTGALASRFEAGAYAAGDCTKVFDPTCMRNRWLRAIY
jgi:hypothetical protein